MAQDKDIAAELIRLRRSVAASLHEIADLVDVGLMPLEQLPKLFEGVSEILKARTPAELEGLELWVPDGDRADGS